MTFPSIPRARRVLGLTAVAGCAATAFALPAHGAPAAPATAVEKTLGTAK